MKVWVGFSTTNLWISRLIRFFTRSKASHAWLSYESNELNSIIVLEAHYTFRALPYAFFKRQNTIVKEVEITKGDTSTMVAACAKFLGTDYDYTGIVGGLIVSLGNWLKKKWKNPWGNPKVQTCSEAVVRALVAGGYPEADKFDPESVSPQDLIEFLKPPE
jgi:hypothetical protein